MASTLQRGETPSVCSGCGAAVAPGQGWVRSGRLLCSDCDFTHKSNGRQAQRQRSERRANQPRRTTHYFKPQYNDPGALAWKDIQRVCDTEAEALAVARAEAPKAASQVRAMFVDPAKGRYPLPAQAR